MSQAVTSICPNCGVGNPPQILACPACHRLVHATRLGELAAEASAAESAADVVRALSLWREALELLPPGTTQYQTVHDRVDQLSRKVAGAGFSAGASAAANRSRHVPAWLASLGAVGLLLWKLQGAALFILTKGKLLLLGLTNASTFLSMFVFLAAYWTLFGWPFALGMVICIYIHEMGHVDALRRYGIKATAPMFLPGLGAVVRLKQSPANPTEDGRIGLAGPLWGVLAALACYAIHLATKSPLFAALTHMGALINLFNLIPIAFLDGDRGLRPLSRNQALLLCLALGLGWFFTHEGMFLLVGIVAMMRTMMKPRDLAGDRMTLAIYLGIVASLAALVCVHAPTR